MEELHLVRYTNSFALDIMAIEILKVALMTMHNLDKKMKTMKQKSLADIIEENKILIRTDFINRPDFQMSKLFEIITKAGKKLNPNFESRMYEINFEVGAEDGKDELCAEA